MVNTRGTHIGTCRACGRIYMLTTADVIWTHQARYDAELGSGRLTAYVECPGSRRQPKRGTRRPRAMIEARE